MDNDFLSCSFKDGSSFTVGEVKELICIGDVPTSLSSNAKIEFLDPTYQYSLKILGVSFTSGEKIIFQVTGYKTGKYTDIHFQITDKDTFVYVKNLSWTIPSILNEEQQVSMYPSYGPWLVSYPTWYLWSFGICILLLIGVGISWMRKYYTKKKIKQKVIHQLQDKTPLQYFIQQISMLMIHHQNWSPFKENLDRLKNIFREFLEHQFHIATELSTKKAITQLKHQQLSDQLKKEALYILLEFDKINTNISAYSKQDGEQLLEMIRKWVLLITKEDKK